MISNEELKIIYISPYYPRQCGIASYTKDLFLAYSSLNLKNKLDVAVIDDKQDKFIYPKEVKMRIQYDNLADYRNTAEKINASDYDFVHLQHEFGLYEGRNGSYILDLVNNLKKPFVVTFHTVLSNPDSHKIEIIRSLTGKAAAVIVMASEAIRRLNEIYQLNSAKIYKIPHGVPLVDTSAQVGSKSRLGFSSRKIISTFGLISQNKGIEYVIEAMPEVVEKFPDALYLIIGKTHPVVRRHEGEKYREILISLSKKYKIEKNIKFINHYLALDNLVRYLQATDIYITPYLEPEQITSGTLTYALGAGKVCISTPYAYAQEVLSDGRGCIVPFMDSQAIAKKISGLLMDDNLRADISKKAYDYSREMIWDNVANNHFNLFRDIKS